MAIIQHDEFSRLYLRVIEYYLAHPDLIASLVRKIGGDNVREFNGEVRSTCPIHGGRNDQAFAVWYDRGRVTWKCHTDCQEKGSLAKLLMRRYKSTFQSAVGALARFAGLQVEGNLLQVSRQTLEEESIGDMKRRLGLNETEQNKPNIFPEGMIHYSMKMLHEQAGKEGLKYLVEERKFPIEILAQFEIGFVPGNVWVYKDVDQAGKEVKKGWFEDRVSFPWRLLNGQLIGFSGRRMDDTGYLKYKTLSGTGRAWALWGLHHPKCQEMIRRTRRLHLVEGFTDVMRAHMFGYYNTVARGGAELTPQQLHLLYAYPLEAIVNYEDNDEAGRVSSDKLAAALATRTQIMVATPPQGMDPDDLVTYQSFVTPLVQARPHILTPKE